MSDPRKPQVFVNTGVDDGESYHCDLCYREVCGNPRRDDQSYVIAELRVVCAECMRRFADEYTEMADADKTNHSIGLVKRGCYADGRPVAPPSNGLGGRD